MPRPTQQIIFQKPCMTSYLTNNNSKKGIQTTAASQLHLYLYYNLKSNMYNLCLKLIVYTYKVYLELINSLPYNAKYSF